MRRHVCARALALAMDGLEVLSSKRQQVSAVSVCVAVEIVGLGQKELSEQLAPQLQKLSDSIRLSQAGVWVQRW